MVEFYNMQETKHTASVHLTNLGMNTSTLKIL